MGHERTVIEVISLSCPAACVVLHRCQGHLDASLIAHRPVRSVERPAQCLRSRILILRRPAIKDAAQRLETASPPLLNPPAGKSRRPKGIRRGFQRKICPLRQGWGRTLQPLFPLHQEHAGSHPCRGTGLPECSMRGDPTFIARRMVILASEDVACVPTRTLATGIHRCVICGNARSSIILSQVAVFLAFLSRATPPIPIEEAMGMSARSRRNRCRAPSQAPTV